MTPTLFKNAITTGPKGQDVNLRRANYSTLSVDRLTSLLDTMPPKAASKQRSVTSSIPSSPVSHKAKQELPSLHPNFCDPKADLSLESCDGQRFAVHKYWLQAARWAAAKSRHCEAEDWCSPVFSKMLEGDLTPSVIPLDETSEEVANLLELIRRRIKASAASISNLLPRRPNSPALSTSTRCGGRNGLSLSS